MHVISRIFIVIILHAHNLAGCYGSLGDRDGELGGGIVVQIKSNDIGGIYRAMLREMRVLLK